MPAGRIVRLDTAAAAALPGVRVVVTAADAPRDLQACSSRISRCSPARRSATPASRWRPSRRTRSTPPRRRSRRSSSRSSRGSGRRPTRGDRARRTARPPRRGTATHALLEGERDGNVAWMPALACGDVDREFARDDVVIVEDAFETARQHQSYIEPRCAVARFEGGRCVIHASTQFPHLVRDRVAEALELRAVARACARQHRRRRLRGQARRGPRALRRPARPQGPAPGQARLHPRRGVRGRDDARERLGADSHGGDARRHARRPGGERADGRRRLCG